MAVEVYKHGARWYVKDDANEVPEPVAGFEKKQQALDYAIEMTGGRSSVRVRSSKTGRFTDESR